MRTRPRAAVPGRRGAVPGRLAGGRALTIPEAWQLELGEPFEARHSELVAPVRLPDGTEAVLKVALEDDTESLYEPEALAFWNGEGTVRLLAHDPPTRAMLIERCVPGTPLGSDYDDPSIEIAASALQRLWRVPPDDVPWPRLEDNAARWLEELPLRYDGRILDEALDAIQTLLPMQAGVVLCHQDLHGGNILSAEREPWLVIDSKPILAEPAYDAVALIRDDDPTSAELRRRLDLMSELLGLDRERVRLWGIVKTLAWDNPEEAQLFSEVGSRR